VSRERFNPLKGMLAQQTDELLNDDVEQSEQKTIERIVEVTRPVQTDTDGVTWVGNIGVTAMGLDLPEALTQEEWRSFLNAIQSVKQSYQFVIGDWFAAGKDRFNVSYEEIAALTGFKVKTVEIWASACRNVPKFTRVNFLTFAHHRAVAILPPERQLQALQYAFENGLSARQLDAEIRGKKPRLKSGKAKQPAPLAVQKKSDFKKQFDQDWKRPEKRDLLAKELDDLEQWIRTKRAELGR
jgi:hypothetical protein